MPTTPTYSVAISTNTYTQTRIRHLLLTEQPDDFNATIDLDDSDGGVAANLKGLQATITLGGTARAPQWVVNQRQTFSPGRITTTLKLEGLPNFLKRDKASNDFVCASDNPSTILQLLEEILEGSSTIVPEWATSTAYVSNSSVVIPTTPNGYLYICTYSHTSGAEPTWPTTIGSTVGYWRCVARSPVFVFNHCATYTLDESAESLLTTIKPGGAFHINFGESRWEVVQRLLSYVKSVIRHGIDGSIDLIVPADSGTDHSYAIASDTGFFWKDANTSLTLPNRVDVESMPDDSPQYSGSATNADNSVLDIRTFMRTHLNSNAEATSIAQAVIANLALMKSQGAALVVLNPTQYLYQRASIAQSGTGNTATGNVGYIQAEAGPGVYRMTIALGGIGNSPFPVLRPYVPARSDVPAPKNDRFGTFYDWFSNTFWPTLDSIITLLSDKVNETITRLNSLIEQVNSTKTTTFGIVFVIDGAGSEIADGQKGHLKMPFDCLLTAVEMEADQSGSIVVDIWKDTYANFPPTDADSITGATPPTITTATKAQDADITDWLRSVAAGDILAFNVDSCTTITRVTITLTAERVTT